MDISVERSGPILTGRGREIMGRLSDEISDEVAQEGFNRVHIELGHVLKHPTGYYESKVATDRVSTGIHTVTDGDVIYGPWLEGTSSRNLTTRFKGYTTFRRITQKLDADVPHIAAGPLARALRELS
jgi:hypothetical protein